MSTDLATVDAATLEAAENSAPPADEIHREVEATDPGPLPTTEDQRTLYRVLRLRGRLEDERERVKEMMGQMLRQLDNRISGLDFYYNPLLADITRKMLGSGKAKSVKTPFGIAGFRASAPRVAVVDPAKVPDAFVEVEQVRKVVAAKVAEHFKATGEIPAGCDLVPAKETFYAK